MFTFFQKILLVICFLKKGGPIRLISFGRRRFGLIKIGSLYRRSKVLTKEDHWNHTRLGEISTNWSKLCKSPKDVLFDSTSENVFDRTTKLIHQNQCRVYICDLEVFNENYPDHHPFINTIEFNQDLLRIEVVHNQNLLNYPHTDINCYLTTKDGRYKDEIILAENWEKSPIKSKELKGLRNKYKTHLIYHFGNYKDYS
jgi:hypothetical protein